ncbi:MAG: nucleotide exchange factor GrpE [Candidatus Woesearchaeota archaeon]
MNKKDSNQDCKTEDIENKCNCDCQDDFNCNKEESCDCDELCGSKSNDCKKSDDCENKEGKIQNPQDDIVKQNENLKKQCDEFKTTLQRVFAEFQNYKKRTVDERQKTMELATVDLVKRLLPILDTLEMALAHKKIDDDFSRGIELIHVQFVQLLEDEGVKTMISKGKFDPKLHEVLLTEESDKEEGLILEEIQKGYTLGNKVIRHSKVKIAKQKLGLKK